LDGCGAFDFAPAEVAVHDGLLSWVVLSGLQGAGWLLVLDAVKFSKQVEGFDHPFENVSEGDKHERNAEYALKFAERTSFHGSSFRFFISVSVASTR
jgi:hypothetical protein